MKAGIRAVSKMQLMSWWLVAVCLLGYGRISAAFESAEHKLLGDTAVLALQQQYQCGTASETHAELCQYLAQIDGSRAGVASYGDIVACVDYFLTPEKLMSGFAESKQHLIEAWPNALCDGNVAKMFQASHSNHTHFQQELLVSLHTYHQLASAIARDRKKLGGALLINAIADHYLHDFFAPGHITVRRDRLSDLFANAMHDAANSEGATFHLAGEKGLARVREKIAFILQTVASDSSPRSRKVRDYVQGPARQGAGCKHVAEVLAAGTVILKGDGLLQREDGCQQRLLMLAANMLSIEDVLVADQGYYQAYYFDYTEAKDWDILKPFSYMPSIKAELPFGNYVLGNHPEVGDNMHDRLLPLARHYVFGINLAEEQFSSGTGVARSAGTLEVVPFGAVSPGFFGNYGLALGLYGYGGSGDVSGAGVSARLGFIIPESESTLSFGIRRVNHSGSVMNEWGTGWSVRFDQGYTSFLSLYVSVGRDYAAESADRLAFGTYLSAGVMIAAPTSRIRACLSGKCM